MRRLALALSFAPACTHAKPPPPAPPVAATSPASDTEAEPADPDTAPEAAPAPEPEPLEPFELSDAELARAKKYQKIVKRASTEHGVDANLLNGIIWIETKFNARARNRSGAAGLMQLMPITSKAMAKRLQRAHRPLDPDFNIHAGAKLLSQLQNKFDGNEELALFGYARGGGRVRAWQQTPGQPLPDGVQAFIRKVRRAQLTFRELGFPDAM